MEPTGMGEREQSIGDRDRDRRAVGAAADEKSAQRVTRPPDRRGLLAMKAEGAGSSTRHRPGRRGRSTAVASATKRRRISRQSEAVTLAMIASKTRAQPATEPSLMRDNQTCNRLC